MPLIKNSTYRSPILYLNKHIATILPSAFRKINWNKKYTRETITTRDNDFLQLDWIFTKKSKLVILTHGLEGHSNRPYVRGMAKIFNNNGYDILAWNCRTCDGKMNNSQRMYCHAHWDDLDDVIDHVNNNYDYQSISLVGYSMGANLSLNYLSQKNSELPTNIKSSVVFSAPCLLEESVNTLDIKANFIYRNKFKKGLWSKILLKNEQFPGIVNLSDINKVKKWKDFDEFFTSKINGFNDADDFYYKGSPHFYLQNISIPTLIINAQNDPLLTPKCAPKQIAKNHPYLYLELPKKGGHVGFYDYQEHIWSERRALEFIQTN